MGKQTTKILQIMDNIYFIGFILGIVALIYMAVNPTSSFAKNYEVVREDRRQRRREFLNSIGINVQPT